MEVNVYFIGAGPGAADLVTLRAKSLIEKADVVIYADSLVNDEILAYAGNGAEIHRSASLALGEIIDIIEQAVNQGKLVARVHSGDPAIFGAIREQMEALDKLSIKYEVVPGVSSLFAAAAALMSEMTVPEIAQTVIITRVEGRTPVPEVEALHKLAAHRTSMAIFLSISLIEKVVEELISGGYAQDTPAAIVYKASWPDQIILRGTLSDIVSKVREAKISRHAIIFVGQFLARSGKSHLSKLYAASFKHGYRD